MKSGFRLIPNPRLEGELTEFLAMQRKEILAGKLSVKWSQARCGYVIRSGRSAVLGLSTFMNEAAAWEWLAETHGIPRPS